MHLILIQAVVILFAAYAGMRTVGRFRSGVIGLGECFVWLGFWCGVGVCVLVPQLIQRFAQVLGVGRGADAIFYLGLVGLSYAFFRLYLRQRQTEHQITVLVRKLALKEGPKRHEP